MTSILYLFLGLICIALSIYFQNDENFRRLFIFFYLFFLLCSCINALPVFADENSSGDIDVAPVFENSAWLDTTDYDNSIVLEDEPVDTAAENTTDISLQEIIKNLDYQKLNTYLLALILSVMLIQLFQKVI